MLCRKFKQFPVKFTNNRPSHALSSTRLFSKRCAEFLNSVRIDHNMSSTFRLRHIFKDLVVSRLLSGWKRSFLVNSVVKRYRRDRGVRDVIQCFKQAFFKPRRTLFLTVTAAHKPKDDGPPSCSNSISDEDMQALASEMDNVEELARATLYCKGCDQRVVFDKKHEGVLYCACKEAPPPDKSFDGWVPYMEAEDVIIWRKDYKPGIYAYKAYGRYKEIKAEDFAAIQVDGAYRRAWDTAVAALSIVERQANGVPDQTVLHWEVLWPRLFANRDYVYIRRHKQFNVKSKCLKHKEGLFNPDNPCGGPTVHVVDRPNVHSNAKRISMENDQKEKFDPQKKIAYLEQQLAELKQQLADPEQKKPETKPKIEQRTEVKDSKVYVIISRSCSHEKVPVTRNAVRVTEYWSHMVVKTLNGPNEVGAEFILTYYDEPTVGGMPTALTSFATGRAVPAFLARMRKATNEYRAWLDKNHQVGTEFILTYYDEPTVGGMPTALTSFATGRAVPAFLARMRKATNEYRAWLDKNHQETPDFMPFSPEKVSYRVLKKGEVISEEDMESSKQGPEIDVDKADTNDGTNSRGSQTPPPGDDATNNDAKVEKPKPESKRDEPPPPPPPSPIPFTIECKDGANIEEKQPEDVAEALTELIVEQAPKVEEAVVEDSEGENSEGEDSVVEDSPLYQEDLIPFLPPIWVEDVRETNPPKPRVEIKQLNNDNRVDNVAKEGDSNTPECDEENGEEGEKNSSWWRYLYPFYYFV